MVFKSSINSAVGSGGGVTSLNGETSDITLTSNGATILITKPTASTINLETASTGSIPQASFTVIS